VKPSVAVTINIGTQTESAEQKVVVKKGGHKGKKVSFS
jgi:hypothetical protein